MTTALKLSAFVVPEGWTLEDIVREPHQALLSTPLPVRYSVTLDFSQRGFRQGYCTIGLLVGEKWGKRRTSRAKYGGRGWQQKVVDDAVTYLREVLK